MVNKLNLKKLGGQFDPPVAFHNNSNKFHGNIIINPIIPGHFIEVPHVIQVI